MSTRTNSLIIAILYWCIGAPTVYLATHYVGILPIVVLSPPEGRSPAANLAIAPYGILVVVTACYLTWACWRAVRGQSPSTAFRPFPWYVWIAALVIGFIVGTVAFLRAA